MKEHEIKHEKWGFSFYKKLKSNKCDNIVIKKIVEANDPKFSSFLISMFLEDSKLVIGQINENEKICENWWVEHKERSKEKVIDSKVKKIYNKQDYCAIEIMSFNLKKLNDENLALLAYLATGKNKENIEFVKKNKILSPSQEILFKKIVSSEIAKEINKKIPDNENNSEKEFEKLENRVVRLKRNINFGGQEKKTN